MFLCDLSVTICGVVRKRLMKQTRKPRCLRAGRSTIWAGQTLSQFVYHQGQTCLVAISVVLVKQSAGSCLVNYADRQAILASSLFGIGLGTQVSNGGPILRTIRPIAVALFGGSSNPLDTRFMLRHYNILSYYHNRSHLASKYSRQNSFVNQ